MVQNVNLHYIFWEKNAIGMGDALTTLRSRCIAVSTRAA